MYFLPLILFHVTPSQENGQANNNQTVPDNKRGASIFELWKRQENVARSINVNLFKSIPQGRGLASHRCSLVPEKAADAGMMVYEKDAAAADGARRC